MTERRGIPLKSQVVESKDEQEREKEKEWFANVLKEHEILQRTIKDIVTHKSVLEEEIPTTWRVPLLATGTTLEAIVVGDAGWILFEIGGEQVKCKCKNIDDEDFGQYVTVFTVTVPNNKEEFQHILRGSGTQLTINTYVSQETAKLQNINTVSLINALTTITTLNTVQTLQNIEGIANLQVLKGTMQAPLTRSVNFAALGIQTLLTVPLQTVGKIIHIGDIAVSGDTTGYAWLEYAGVVVWGYLDFALNSGWAQQFRSDFNIISDGVNSLLLRAYLTGAGRASGSMLYSLE